MAKLMITLYKIFYKILYNYKYMQLNKNNIWNKFFLATEGSRNCVTMDNSEKEYLQMQQIDSHSPRKYD